jgi:DNA-binding NarL/FixJ family response regulator
MPPERPRRPIRLSPRQADVLVLLAQGLTDKEIAARLDLSIRTVRAHVHAAMSRLDARTRPAAIAAALRYGSITD